MENFELPSVQQSHTVRLRRSSSSRTARSMQWSNTIWNNVKTYTQNVTNRKKRILKSTTFCARAHMNFLPKHFSSHDPSLKTYIPQTAILHHRMAQMETVSFLSIPLISSKTVFNRVWEKQTSGLFKTPIMSLTWKNTLKLWNASYSS